MPTNNMIKSKSSEYSCSRICNVDVQISEIKQRRTKQQTTQRRIQTTKSRRKKEEEENT